MGPTNGIIGDDSLGLEIPVSDITKEGLNETKKAARFSKTKEFAELKTYLEGRMDFYQQYLPNGEPVIGKPDIQNLGGMWLAANCIIGELKAIISAYEQAAEIIKEDNVRRKNT